MMWILFFVCIIVGIALNKGVAKNRSFWSLGHSWALASHSLVVYRGGAVWFTITAQESGGGTDMN